MPRTPRDKLFRKSKQSGKGAHAEYGRIYIPKDVEIVVYHSGKCRECSEVRAVDWQEQHSKTPPRCHGCGGMLDLSEDKVESKSGRKPRRKQLEAGTKAAEQLAVAVHQAASELRTDTARKAFAENLKGTLEDILREATAEACKERLKQGKNSESH